MAKVIVCNLSGTGHCKGDCAKCKWLPQVKIVSLDQMQDDPDAPIGHSGSYRECLRVWLKVNRIPYPKHYKKPRLIEPIWLLLEKAGYTQEANRLKRRLITEKANHLAKLMREGKTQ